MEDEALLHQIYLTALDEPWVPNGPHYVNLSPMRSGGRAIAYTMKEGFDHVMGVPWEKEPVATR
jgi:hypothetical protein